jgi:ADP-heptose:LPS heptosyltransferase
MTSRRKRIVVYGFLGLGDMVMFSQCFRILRNGFPNSKITLVTGWKVVYELFKESQYIDECIYFDLLNASTLAKMRFVISLRNRHFDTSILPYPSYRRELDRKSVV